MTTTPRPRLGFVLMVGAMAALPATSIDIYLPSLPDVTRDLGTTDAVTQLTITGTMVGAALGQLIVGPLSDRFGRRRPVMIGLTVHVLASLLCALAPGALPLVALRVIQGMANASATVVAMSVVRDRFRGAEAARMMSQVFLVIGVAPLFAPTIGGFVAGHWGWRAVFVTLAGAGLALLVLVASSLPETLPPERRFAGGLTSALRAYGVLLRDRHFLALAVLPGLGMAALVSYVVGSPFVLRAGFGLSEQEFALLFAINGLGFVAGAQTNAMLVRRIGPLRLLRVALPSAVIAGAVLLTSALTGAGGLVGLMVPLWFLMALMGMIPANAVALALDRQGGRVGTAAALIGGLQTGTSGLVGSLVGVLGATAVAMASVIVGTLCVALTVLATATPAYRRGGWLERD